MRAEPMLDAGLLSRLEALGLALRRRVRGGAGGVRPSRALGSSAEFSDYRAYMPGDDVRRIDWNAYARFDKLFLKRFLEEQEAVFTVILDASASMRAKWTTARELAEAMGYLALCGGDRLEIVALSREGAARRARFLARHDAPRVAAFLEGLEPAGATELNGALGRVVPSGRGMCILVSDLMAEAGFSRGLAALSQRGQEIAVVHVLSREELKPALSGAVRLIDAEGGPSLELEADSGALAAYGRALEEFLAQARAASAKYGAAYALIDAEQPIERLLLDSLRGILL